MRRKEREVTDVKRVSEIISKCSCCRLGLCDDGQVYIVPLNFGFTEENGKFTFYFHCAKEGKKIDIIERNPNVGFELDAECKILAGEIACDYTADFQSIIGNGKISIVRDTEGKIRGLNEIMNHTVGKRDWNFSKKSVNAVCVLQLNVESISAKEHISL